TSNLCGMWRSLAGAGGGHGVIATVQSVQGDGSTQRERSPCPPPPACACACAPRAQEGGVRDGRLGGIRLPGRRVFSHGRAACTPSLLGLVRRASCVVRRVTSRGERRRRRDP